jgi:hypothetical protein
MAKCAHTVTRCLNLLFIAVLLSCCTSLFALTPLPVHAETGRPDKHLMPDSLAKISRFEHKLFARDYSEEPDVARIERLERFCFGDALDGSVKERLQVLTSIAAGTALPQSVAADHVDARPIADQYSNPKAPHTSDLPSALSQNPKPTTEQTASDVLQSETPESAQAAANSDDPQPAQAYPRVAFLETKLLGQAYDTDPIEQRLSRLEMKEFGDVKQADLSDRTDRLYTHTHLKNDLEAPSLDSIIADLMKVCNPRDSYQYTSSHASTRSSNNQAPISSISFLPFLPFLPNPSLIANLCKLPLQALRAKKQRPANPSSTQTASTQTHSSSSAQSSSAAQSSAAPSAQSPPPARPQQTALKAAPPAEPVKPRGHVAGARHQIFQNVHNVSKMLTSAGQFVVEAIVEPPEGYLNDLPY